MLIDVDVGDRESARASPKSPSLYFEQEDARTCLSVKGQK